MYFHFFTLFCKKQVFLCFFVKFHWFWWFCMFFTCFHQIFLIFMIFTSFLWFLVIFGCFYQIPIIFKDFGWFYKHCIHFNASSCFLRDLSLFHVFLLIFKKMNKRLATGVSNDGTRVFPPSPLLSPSSPPGGGCGGPGPGSPPGPGAWVGFRPGAWRPLLGLMGLIILIRSLAHTLSSDS